MVVESIIVRCLRREAKAQQALYEQSAPYVFSIVKNYIKDSENRKDVLQDIYIEIFSSLGSYRKEKGKFKSWIARITVNVCINAIRKKRLLLVELDERAEEGIAPVQLNELSKKDLENILEKMPEGYRIVFLLHAIDGYSHVEIGEMLDIRASSSRSQYSRALKWIHQNLSKLKQIKAYGIS